MRGLGAAAVAVAALAFVGGASANKYVGTLATGGTATIAGTFIKCIHNPTVGIACYVERGGGPARGSWAATISDSRVQVGSTSAAKPAYTSPKEPAAGGKPESKGVKKLTVRVNENFGAAGRHTACSVIKPAGKIGVACTLVDTKGAVKGAYGFFLTTHEVQVRTTQGSSSKVLFDKKF